MIPARLRLFGLSLLALAAILLLVVAAFPWGYLKGVVAARLSDRFDSTVTIDRIERVDSFGFTPTIAIRGARIPQPGWAGTGDLARIDRAQATFSVWPLILGRFEPRDIRVDGVALALVRDRDGRSNWQRQGAGKLDGGGGATDIGRLTITNGQLSLRDDKRDRRLTATFTSDAKTGLRARGNGVVAGAAVALTFTGAPVAGSGPWRFAAAIDGADLAMTAKGTMDRPLDTGAMTIDVTARASDLKLIDGVIEAGLFGTQPVALAAHVRHDAQRWVVTGMTGTIGRSDIAGGLTVDKQDGRTKITGDVTARQFDFDDLSTDRGQAEGRALEARIGPRVVPNTRINLAKIGATDGKIGFKVGHLLSGGKPLIMRGGSGVLTLDHRLLTLTSLSMQLDPGRLTGTITIDQHDDRPSPLLTVDLTMTGATLAELTGGEGGIDAHVTARATLKGTGDTIRAAIARSDGRIGFVARDGTLPRRFADALGFDVGRALVDGSDGQAGLRCMIVSLDMRHGDGTVAPMVLDTTQSGMRGDGGVSFPDERIDIRLVGAPKQDALLRLPGAAFMTGTLRAPSLVVPREVKSVGNIFKAIGRAINGTQGKTAVDADCGALAARALR